MDLLPLNSLFKPSGVLIEGWSSLIWTERYRGLGEFSLESPNIEDVLALLPLASCVTVDSSNEIMIVETHEITKDPDGEAVIKTSGRTLDSILEGRMAIYNTYPLKEQPFLTPPQSPKWKTSSLTASACATVMLQYHLVDGRIYANDIVPNLTVGNYASKTQTAKVRQIERGQLSERVFGVLAEENLGLRNVRPTSTGTNASMQVYNGTDRSATLALDVTAGHFDQTKYIFSIKGYKDYAFVVTQNSTWSDLNLNRYSGSQGGGLDRRDLLIDADDIEEPAGSDLPAMQARAHAAFKDHDLIRLFDGTVSITIPYIYGTHYFMGDILKVYAEYGVVENMMVTEYIRVEDKDGEREYPTLDFYSL